MKFHKKRSAIAGTRKNIRGRDALPEHLPVREVIIEPEEDTTGLKKIGEEVTETLEYSDFFRLSG